MRMKYLGDTNHATPEVLIGPNGEQVPTRDLTDDEGKQFRELISAHKKATGRALYEPIHEEPAKADAKDGN